MARLSLADVTTKLKFATEGYGRKLVSEMWMYSDNSLLLSVPPR